MVTWYKIRHTGWLKNAVDLNTKEFQLVKLDFPLFSMTRVFWPCSVAEFEPCDQPVSAKRLLKVACNVASRVLVPKVFSIFKLAVLNTEHRLR